MFLTLERKSDLSTDCVAVFEDSETQAGHFPNIAGRPLNRARTHSRSLAPEVHNEAR